MLEGWNWYHKSAVFTLWGVGALMMARAIICIDGGTYEVKTTHTVAAPAAAVWPWVTSMKDRPRWLAGVVDITPLTGEPATPGSTRMMFWRERYHRWTAIEQTSEDVVPERRYRTIQQSDADTRIHQVDLQPAGDCRTEITLTEQIRPSRYTDRLWAFLFAGEAEDRLKVSAEALDRWLKDTGAGCGATGDGDDQKASTS